MLPCWCREFELAGETAAGEATIVDEARMVTMQGVSSQYCDAIPLIAVNNNNFCYNFNGSCLQREAGPIFCMMEVN